jgi:hypothetical protein
MTNAEDYSVGCGHSVPAGARFCPECGRPVKAAEPASQLPQWPWAPSAEEPFPPEVAHEARDTGGLQRMPAPRPSRRRPVLPMILGGVGVVAIAVVAVVLLSRHPGNASAESASPTSTTHAAAATTPAARPSAAPSAARGPDLAELLATPRGKAATALAALLGQAARQVGPMSGVMADVRDCGSKLQADRLTFAQAAGDREQLLSRLARMKDRSALPAAMLADLTDAWRAEVLEYTDLAHWANDAVNDGCDKASIASDANLIDSAGPKSQSKQDATSFVRSWDPLAGEYRLTIYPYYQI